MSTQLASSRALALSLLILGLPALGAGCSDDAVDPTPPSEDASSDGADVEPPDAGDASPDDVGAGEDAEPDASPDAVEDVADATPAPEGVRVRMETEADLDADFFAWPWPSDLRLDADGTVNLQGVVERTRSRITRNLVEAANQLEGYPTLAVGWFGFDGAIGARTLDDVIAPSPTADILLVLVEPGHPDRGRLAPVVAQTLEPDPYVDEHVLAVGAQPGWVLTPGVRWAWVVTRSLGDADGEPLGVAEPLWAALRGDGSGDPEIEANLAPLIDLLPELGIDPEQIAAASVFTTASVVEDLHAMSESIRAAYDPVIENLEVPEGRGLTWERYCELHGEIELPQFQQGVPAFDQDGLFVVGDDGLPIEQRMETIPVVVTVPRREMPVGGYPLVMYFHGSGGISTQLVDRGPQSGPDEPEAPGLGPAWVLAEHGFAMAGSAHPVNPERVPGASGLAYLNFGNLKAFRDTFRQGTIEQRLYLDALLDLRIDPELLAECEGASLPDGEDSFRFQEEQVFAMGQSMGGMYTNMVGAIEPRITAVVPTGAGGFWSYFILKTELVPGAAGLVGSLLQTPAELSHLHPAMHILQTAWEFAEPFVYTPRLAREPLDGHPVRPIYQPVGEGDSYFPTPIFDAIAIAYGNQQAGPEVWPGMQTALAVTGLDGLAEYPVQNNRTGGDGTEYTGVVVQFEGDGFTDPHHIFAQFDEVKHQYGCFFATFRTTGVATVPAPAPLGTDCLPN